MKNKKKYVYKKTLIEIDECDLDLQLQDDIFGLNVDGHDIENYINIKDEFYYNDENEYLNIDRAIEILNELKKKGASHVDITPHCDHHAYVFYGSIIREATKKDVEEDDIKRKKARKKMLETSLNLEEKQLEDKKKELEKLRNDCKES